MWCLYTLTWMISVRKRDLSLIEILWGVSFCIQTAIYYSKSLDYTFFHIFTPDRFSWEKFTFAALVFIHGLRLAAYLMARDSAKDQEDSRWAALRERFGKHFWWISYFYVFIPALLTNLLMGCTIYAFENKDKSSINHFEYWIGILTMIAGGLFGSIADLQKFSFDSQERNQGKLLDTGLWGLCRHPNYFGEALFWWGTFIVNYSAGTIWTIICPLLLHFMIVYVTGIPAAEKEARERYGSQYDEYCRRVPRFLPLRLFSHDMTRKGETSDTKEEDEHANNHHSKSKKRQ